MAERDALAGGGGLDDHRGIAEAGAALDVDAADAGGLQPVAPVRALVLARDLVVQQGVIAQVLRGAQRERALQKLWAAHRAYLDRSEARRVGTTWVRWCRCRGAQCTKKIDVNCIIMMYNRRKY